MTERSRQGQLAGTLAAALNPLLRNIQNDSAALQLPDLALRCAQFFHSLSQYCLTYYRNDTKQKELLKTKTIKKEQKQAKEKGQRGRRKKETEREQGAALEPPRKPLTAYIIYFQDKKHHFVERYPTLNLSELTKLIAKEWKEISDKERQVFLDRAADDRKRYEEQMQEFKRTYGRAARFPEEEDEQQDAQPQIDEEGPLEPEDLPQEDIAAEEQDAAEEADGPEVVQVQQGAEEGSWEGDSDNNDSSQSVQVIQKEKDE